MLEVNLTPFPQLSTARMLLRKINEADAAQIFKLRSDKEVMKYLGKKEIVSIDEAKTFMNLIGESLVKNDGITWGMATKESPETLIGTIGLWRIVKEHYRAEIGYMLLPEFWRKGLMKEAILEVTGFGFNELKLHSIEGRINALNTASAKILESAGFVKEAHFKEDYFFAGKFEDTEIYSLLEM